MNQEFQVEQDALDGIVTAHTRVKASKRGRVALLLAQDRACSIDDEAGGAEVEDGAERELLRELDSLIKHVKALIESHAMLFRVERLWGRRYNIKSTPLGGVFFKMLRIAPIIEDYFSHHHLHPHFKLFQECVSTQPMDLSFDMNFNTEEQPLAMVQQLNALVDHIRARGQSKKFSAACKNFHRSSDKNHREILAYVKRHSELTGRLLIGRCDVGVKKAAKFHLGSRMQQLKTLRKARIALFDFIKSKFGGRFLGFAWKLEFGPKRGFHLHLMFIFNGRDLNSDIPIVRMIGEHWKHEIMGGGGTYYNCNAFKGSYKECGIGQYSKNIDSGKWKGIELMCAYLTKPDDLVRLHFKGMRTFAKGNFPKDKQKKSKTMTELAAGG